MNKELLQEFVDDLGTKVERVVEWNVSDVDPALAKDLRQRLYSVCNEIQTLLEEH